MTDETSQETVIENEEETKCKGENLVLSDNSTHQLNENSINKLMDKPDKEKFEVQEKRIDPSQYFKKKGSLLPPKWEKFILISLSISIIVFVWLISICAITIEIFIDLGTISIQLESFNVTDELENILHNFTNQSIKYIIHCPTNQIHSESSLFCSPSCTYWDLHFSDVGLLIETIIILFIDITGVILGILTLITWPFVKSFWKFPQITIFFLVVCISLFTLTFAIVDIPGFYCAYDGSNSFADLNVNFQPHLMGAGAVIHFLRIAIMFWTLFALFNIFISTLSPVMFNPSGKLKICIILVEFVISFGIPLLFIIVTLSSKIGLFWNSFGYLPDYGKTPFYILGRIIPDYSTAIFSFTFAVLILARLRFISIDTKSILGNSRKISPLESRLIIYCVVSGLIFYCFIIQVCVYFTYYREDFNNVYDYRSCVTLNSPITVIQGNTTSHYNATSDLLPESIWDRGYECRGVKPYLDKYHPFWGSLYTVCYRLVLVAFFLMFILKSNFLIWVGWFKNVWNKCKFCFKKIKCDV